MAGAPFSGVSGGIDCSFVIAAWVRSPAGRCLCALRPLDFLIRAAQLPWPVQTGKAGEVGEDDGGAGRARWFVRGPSRLSRSPGVARVGSPAGEGPPRPVPASAGDAGAMSNPFLPQVCPEDALIKYVVDPWLPTAPIVDNTSPLRLDRCSLDGEYDSAVRGHCYSEFDQKGFIVFENYKKCQYSPLLLPGWNLLPDWFLQGTPAGPLGARGPARRRRCLRIAR